MDKKKIVEFLAECDLEDIKELSYDDSRIILKFNYYFDDLELEAAEEYANDECEEQSKSESWYYEYLLPYLTDFAMDNVEEIVEECSEEVELNYEVICYEPTEVCYDVMNFIAVFSKDEIDDIDLIMLNLDKK